ncbi:hypothetical protein FKP32DRAFT_1586575 [Trametes sanguinea]|nr:hypothetical protein FKP32DRAFT_1586575 [Trametes sanguinea]
MTADMEPLDATPLAAELNHTFGALLVGTYFGLMLYGFMVHQSYTYFSDYPKDVKVNKIFVIVLLVLETAHSTAALHFCYTYLVGDYLNLEALIYGLWSIDAYPMLSGLCIITSQCFFARRVYLFSDKYRVLVIVAILSSAAALGFSTAGAVRAFMRPCNNFDAAVNDTWLEACAFGLASFSDTLTTSILIINLKRSRTGIKQTDRMLDRIILYSMNTGLLIG